LKKVVPWRRPSIWPITPTAGPLSYTTAAARKYFAKMLSGFGIKELRKDFLVREKLAHG
jgi:hypothetical protein